MSELGHKISLHDGFICKTCKRLTSLGMANEFHGLAFPKEDLSLMNIKCPRCYSTNTYKNEELIKSLDPNNNTVEISEAEQKSKEFMDKLLLQLKEEIAKNQGLKEKLDSQNEELETKNTVIDGLREQRDHWKARCEILEEYLPHKKQGDTLQGDVIDGI